MSNNLSLHSGLVTSTLLAALSGCSSEARSEPSEAPSFRLDSGNWGADTGDVPKEGSDEPPEAASQHSTSLAATSSRTSAASDGETRVRAVSLSSGCTHGDLHRLQPGETLSSVARKYCTSVDAITRLNNIRDPDRVGAGDVLEIPSPHRPSAARADASQPCPAGEVRYLESGQTVAAVAREEEISPTVLLWQNRLSEREALKLQPGFPLCMVQVGSFDTWRLRPGQTLSDVASVVDIGVDELASHNSITNPNQVAEGLVLTIPVALVPAETNRR